MIAAAMSIKKKAYLLGYARLGACGGWSLSMQALRVLIAAGYWGWPLSMQPGVLIAAGSGAGCD